MDYYKIGQFIQERRKQLNLTQKQLGEKINVTDKAVSKWERGLGCPDVSILGELSEVLEVGIGELLNGEYNDNLKDNSMFVKNAVDYSKKITEDNIYNKIRKILYCILILIVFYISFMGIKQFIYMNQEIKVYLVSEVLNNEYEQMKLKVNIIKENNYLDLEAQFILNGIVGSFEENKLLDEKFKYYEVSELSNIFLWYKLAFDGLGSYLIEKDPSNKMFYELLYINEPVDIYNDKLVGLMGGEDYQIYYENMYMYDQMEELDKIKYYYLVLETQTRKLNKVLDYIIEVGEKNA